MKTRMEVKVRFLNTSEGDQETKNLINDGGLNMLASDYVANVFRYIQMGTGTRQNAKSSDGAALTQAGNVVTADVPFFSTEDGTSNRLIIFNNGTQANIVSRISEFAVTVQENQAVAAQTAKIMSIEETALETPVEITGNCVAASNGSTIDFTANVLSIADKRTFTFGNSSGSTIRSEFGWGPTNTLGAAIFGRIVKDVTWLDTNPITIEVIVTRVIDCNIVTIPSLPLTGAAFAATSRLMFGNATLQGIAYRSTVDATTGDSIIGANADVSLLEPFLSPQTDHATNISDTASSLDFANIADTTTGDSIDWTMAGYVAGSFYRDMVVSYNSSAYSSVIWRTISLWTASQSAQFRILFDANQTFDGDLTLLTIRSSWGRI
jgi:hypothetical protein